VSTPIQTAATGLISGDDHIDLCYVPPDLWQSRVAARWRDDAPRVVRTDRGQSMWMREGRPWGIQGSKRADGRKVVFDDVGLAEEPQPGVFRATSAKYRVDDMDRDGIYAQVMYNFLDWGFDDDELKSECVKAFNSWLAEFCREAPNRLVGLAVLPSHDAADATAEMQRVAELGLRGAIFDVFAASTPMTDESWDPLWSAAADTETVLSVHIGNDNRNRRALAAAGIAPPPSIGGTWRLPSQAATTPLQLGPMLGDIIFSGLLERHPRLKLVLGESSLGWIPFVLERLDFEFDNYADHIAGLPQTRPSEQFRRNVWCTFQDEKVGVDLISLIGEDKVMWASDYPHGDGSFPHSREAVERIFACVHETVKRRATHDTARDLYHIT
jgi:predicted TIM-barrel fold metal-dependent hydrolase